MGDLLTFAPRPRPPEPHAPAPLAGVALRERIEAGAQAALDLADSLIEMLGRVDGEPDLIDGGDTEPSLAAPENHHASQVTWLRGNDQDRESEATEIALPEVVLPEVPGAPLPLPWSKQGNVLTAAGVALRDLVGW